MVEGQIEEERACCVTILFLSEMGQRAESQRPRVAEFKPVFFSLLFQKLLTSNLHSTEELSGPPLGPAVVWTALITPTLAWAPVLLPEGGCAGPGLCHPGACVLILDMAPVLLVTSHLFRPFVLVRCL